MLCLLAALATTVPAAGVTLTLAPDAPCVKGPSLVKQLDAMGVQVVTRQAVLDVDITRSGQSLRLRARRRGDEQLLIRTVPAQPADCAAAERVVALLIRSWADTAHLPSVDRPDAGVADASAPNPSPEILANPLAGLDLPKPKPPGPDETPPIPPRPPEPLHKPGPPPRPQPAAPRAVAVELAPAPLPEGPPGPPPRRMVFPSGTDESTVNTAQAMIEARAPKPVTGLAEREERPEEASADAGTEAAAEELAQAETPIEPPSPEVVAPPEAGVSQPAPAPKPASPWVARVALMLGGAFGVAQGASPGGEWIAGLSRGHLAAWLDLGFTLGPSPQTLAGQVDLHREWLSLTFGAVFHPTPTLELGAGLGVRGFRLGFVFDRQETDLLAAGAAAQAYLSVVLAGPFSVWLRGFFTLRAPLDRLTVEGKGTILTLEPWDAGLEAGVGLRFE